MGLMAIWVALGGIVGWTFVPWAADVLLRRAHRRSITWWWDCLRAYQEFKRACRDREPSRFASGEEGALGLWREDALRAAQTGSLARDQAQALLEVGFDLDPEACKFGEDDRLRQCSFVPSPWQRVACAGGCATAFAVLGMLCLSGMAVVLAVPLACCVGAMAVAVVCDLRARTLPLETCVVLAVAGSVFQVLAHGMEGMVAGAVCAVLVVVGYFAANRMFGCRGMAAVGYGDVRCMAALSLACGPATPVGFAACYACAAAFSLGGMASHRLASNDGIPMAPFLALWLACGSVACVSV